MIFLWYALVVAFLIGLVVMREHNRREMMKLSRRWVEDERRRAERGVR